MGRRLREDYDSAVHHIVVKGINRKYIFKEPVNKSKYIDLLKYYKEKHDVKIFAYCVMDNHLHLMIQSGNPKVKKYKYRELNRLCISDFMHDVQNRLL